MLQTSLSVALAATASIAIAASAVAHRPLLGDGQNDIAPQAADATLVGAATALANATDNRAPIAAGTFRGGAGIVDFDSGIVRSSGAVAPAPPALEFVVARSVPGPFFGPPSPCGQSIDVDVGVVTTFTIVASAATGLPGNSVMLSSSALPPGATQNPPLPFVATGPTATVSTTFTWTPGLGATFPVLIDYMATDQLGQTTTCTVQLLQIIECYLFLGFHEIDLPLGPEPDDVLLVEPLAGYPVTTTQIPDLVIPNHPGLLNLTVASQVGMFDPWGHAANPLQMSNGLRLTIGSSTQPYGHASGIDLFGTSPPMLGTTFHFGFTIQ